MVKIDNCGEIGIPAWVTAPGTGLHRLRDTRRRCNALQRNEHYVLLRPALQRESRVLRHHQLRVPA